MHNIQLRLRRITRQPILSVGMSLGFMACGSRSVTPSVTPVPTNPSTATQDVPDRKLTPFYQIYEPGELNYDVEIKTSLQPVLGDSTHRPDSTRVASLIRMRFRAANADGQIIAHAQVDSTILRTTDNSSIQLPAGTFTFRINPKSRQISQDQTTDCSDTTVTTPQLPIQGWEILPTIGAPDVDHWVDTSEVQVCRGNIRVSLTRIATYTVITRGLTTSQISRMTNVSMRGSGYQWNQKVAVSGHGTAVDTISITESRLQSVGGNAQLEVLFDSPLRHQQYVQITSTRITLRR